MQTVADFYQATVATTAEAALVNRLDTSINSLSPPAGQTWKVKGIVARCANVGYVVLRLAGRTILTLDMASLNAMTSPLALDITIKAGQQLTVAHKSSSGTAAITLSLLYDDGQAA